MGFVIGFLTFVMVLDSLALILLVLIQLPKKEAGAGLAFGGAATDALFGAGSGNVLTKITKYSAGTFFVLAVVLSLLQSKYHQRSTSEFQDLINKAPSSSSSSTAPAANIPATPVSPVATPAAGTNLLTVTPQVEATNTAVPAPHPTPAPETKK